jgi:hypothetical protein
MRRRNLNIFLSIMSLYLDVRARFSERKWMRSVVFRHVFKTSSTIRLEVLAFVVLVEEGF